MTKYYTSVADQLKDLARASAERIADRRYARTDKAWKACYSYMLAENYHSMYRNVTNEVREHLRCQK